MESGNQKNKEQKKITRISKEDIEFYTDCRCGVFGNYTSFAGSTGYECADVVYDTLPLCRCSGIDSSFCDFQETGRYVGAVKCMER